MTTRFLKELVTFPMFILALPLTPLFLIYIKLENDRFLSSHEKILAELKKIGLLKELLGYAITDLGIKFSALNTGKKKHEIIWEIKYNLSKKKADTFLGKYVNFIFSLKEEDKQPIVCVQIDKNGGLKFDDAQQLIFLLPHELGHLENELEKSQQCSPQRHNLCLKDELFATLKGIKILMKLGYSLDFQALAKQWVGHEIMTCRCLDCIEDTSCQKDLDKLLSVSQKKDKCYTVTMYHEAIFQAINDL